MIPPPPYGLYICIMLPQIKSNNNREGKKHAHTPILIWSHTQMCVFIIHLHWIIVYSSSSSSFSLNHTFGSVYTWYEVIFSLFLSMYRSTYHPCVCLLYIGKFKFENTKHTHTCEPMHIMCARTVCDFKLSVTLILYCTGSVQTRNHARTCDNLEIT